MNSVIKQEPSDVVTGIDAQIPYKRQPPARRRSWTAWLIRACLRLTVWFCIYTIVVRCPSAISDLDESSPLVCRPYLEAKIRLLPHIRPYYDAHAARYVDAAWPYVQVANDKVVSPAFKYSKQGYDRYGAPQVSKAVKVAKANWDKTARPHLDVLSSRVQDQYDKSVGPFVSQAYAVSAPYYNTASKAAVHHFHATALPLYRKSLPHVQRAYLAAQRFSTRIILPYARYCTDITLQFITREAWPRIRILYGQNVEPQLVKIRERLANYRDAKSIEAAVEEITSSELVSSTSAIASIATTSSKITEVENSSTSSVATEEAASPAPSATDLVKETQRKVSEDLKLWKEKFAKAANRGSEELKERVAKIASHQIDGQVKGVGEALIIELEEAVRSSTGAVQKAIVKAAESLPEEAEDSEVEAAVADTRAAVRSAGQQIKEKAQRVRSWKLTYNKDLSQLVQNSLDSTLDVVDNIRDLGLQEIGMRWAAMEGVTYQDWEEYHTLKKSVDTWRTSIENVPVDHATLADARQAGEDIESQAMAIAEDAAKELARLKGVAEWKVDARDFSDDFSTKSLPARAAKLVQNVVDSVSSAGAAAFGHSTSQDGIESLASIASEGAQTVASSASSVAKDVTSKAASQAERMASVVDSLTDEAIPTASPISGAKDAASIASSSIVSVVSDVSSALDKASSAVIGGAASAVSDASSLIKQTASTVSSDAASAVSIASKSFEKAASLVSSGAASAVSNASDSFGRAASVVSSGAASAVSGASSSIEETASVVSSSAASAVSSVSSSVEKTASTAPSGISAAASSASASVREDVSTPASIASSLSAKVEDNFQAIPSEVSSWIAAAVSASSSFAEQETGSAIVPEQEAPSASSGILVAQIPSKPVVAEPSSHETLAPLDVESVLSSTSSRLSRGMESEISSLQASRKVQSAISEAGDAYDQVTSSLASKVASVTVRTAEPSIEVEDALSEPAEL